MSVREALDSASVAIGASGSPTPRLDAELLLADALGVDRATLFLEPGRTVEGPAVRAFQNAVRRRSSGREPVAYITGRRAFRHIELCVDARVLVPRPETELLVEAAVELLPRGARVADVGTGSGAVALALRHERPDLELVATDVSTGALEVARTNAARLRLDGIDFRHGDLLAGAEPVDAVIANPPYVAEGERTALAPEIVRHEPPDALFAGADGLDLIRRLVPAAAAARARLLALEVGAGQAPAVAQLMQASGFERVTARRDLAGIERVVVGAR